ncbi:hypothetical protein HOG47_05315, partial [archaeon]|nr:hypothetical protein [archaeon]
MIKKILNDVFDYKKGDKIVILHDIITKKTSNYFYRIDLADKWYSEIKKFEENVFLIKYKETGSHNSDFPTHCYQGSKETTFEEVFNETKIVIALTEFSATAPLVKFSNKYEFKAASMPGFNREMLPAMNIDINEIKKRVGKIYDLLFDAESLNIVFDNTELFVDLKDCFPKKDDGHFIKTKVINLPTGEAFIVPKEGIESKTKGFLPILGNLYKISSNQIVSCNKENDELMEKIKLDPMVGNIAEIGLGVLGSFGIKPVGEVLLDE